MSRTGSWCGRLAVALVCAGWLGMAQAEGLMIQSFEGTGTLVFNELSTAAVYRVEWAPTPAGPWTNFTGAAGARLDSIIATGSGSVTCSVPMCYRVVAVFEGDYLVVDLSGGPSASSYPVSYLSAVPGGGWTDEHKTTKLVLRRLPATAPDYTMGGRSTDYPGASDDGLHQVTLTKGFYIGVFEVTQRQWELVMGDKPSSFNNAACYATRPVEQVTYYDIRENPANSAISPNWPASSQVYADSFMGKLRAKTGLAAFDLPTESQWEYACRAGTATALNSGYNLTSTESDARMAEVGRYLSNGGRGSTPDGDTSVGTDKVGSYLPNMWGLYDMHGNVWEWCLDWDGAYPGTVSDPAGAASGYLRMRRGGGYSVHASNCRSAERYALEPNYRIDSTGFRVVRTLP